MICSQDWDIEASGPPPWVVSAVKKLKPRENQKVGHSAFIQFFLILICINIFALLVCACFLRLSRLQLQVKTSKQ